MNIYTFPSFLKITHKDNFNEIIRHGNRFAGAMISMAYLEKGSSRARLGISIGKRYGSSVKRNRFKRIVREAFRLNKHEMPPFDMIVMPLVPSPKAELKTCMNDFTAFITSCQKETV